MPEYEQHPTQKPIALLERIIKASSNPDDIILDPFSGTFTTSFVAKSLGRKSIGIEIDDDYVKIGLRRVLEQTEFNNQPLEKPVKTFQVKNNNQDSLFNL
jgi:site-specific DNA-methyltransferase (adenine-specific)